jgi:hypothetical protein
MTQDHVSRTRRNVERSETVCRRSGTQLALQIIGVPGQRRSIACCGAPGTRGQ